MGFFGEGNGTDVPNGMPTLFSFGDSSRKELWTQALGFKTITIPGSWRV